MTNNSNTRKLLFILMMNPFSILFACFVLGWLFSGTLSFVGKLEGDYKTPWYDTSWSTEPVTNAVLYFGKSKTYWTTNANDSEKWLVKETEMFGKQFWTLLKRESTKEIIIKP